MSKLAAIILTYNEAQRLERCLSALSFFDEIVVLDSGSQDNTCELARQAGTKVCSHPMTEGFAAQRNFALTCTDADWVVFIDADEILTDALVQEIREYADSNEQAAYAIKRLNEAFSCEMRHGVLRPDWVIRVFPRTAVTWEGKVHERPVFSLPVKRCKNFLRHITYTTWEQYFNKFNRYTTLWAEDANRRGKRSSIGKIFLHSLASFIQVTIVKRGWQDGSIGIILCFFHFFYTMVKYTKLYTIQSVGDKNESCPSGIDFHAGRS